MVAVSSPSTRPTRCRWHAGWRAIGGHRRWLEGLPANPAVAGERGGAEIPAAARELDRRGGREAEIAGLVGAVGTGFEQLALPGREIGIEPTVGDDAEQDFIGQFGIGGEVVCLIAAFALKPDIAEQGDLIGPVERSDREVDAQRRA
jgi:hypothetical protein